METLIKLQYHEKQLMENFIRNFKKDGKERRTKTYYDTRLANFKNYWETFKKRDQEIALGATDQEMESEKYFTDEIYSAVENFFIESFALISSDYQRDFPPIITKPVNTENKDVKVVTVEAKRDEVKLPKISLPTFSGDYLSWATFYDLYKALVHENNSLSPVQKLQYLKANLSGEARALLSNTPITNANYEQAWKTLVDRYDNKRILVKSYLDILFGQPAISQESARGVKGLLDKTSECLAALENLQVETKGWDPILIHFITQRLPFETLELWEQSLCSNKELPKWSELKEFLESRFRTLEIINPKRKVNNKESKSSNNAVSHTEKPWRRPQSFHVSTSASCPLCHDTHTIRQCPKYLGYNHQMKLEFVKSKGLCMNCLGSGHLLVKCPSKLKCLICKKSHHTTLHREQNSSEKSRAEGTLSVSTNPSTSQANISEGNIRAFVANSAWKPQQVLLATALVAVITPQGRKQICRALIDPCSQASFVTERIVQHLRLTKESVDLDVSGLGNISTERIKARTILILTSVQSEQSKSVRVEAFVLSKITNMLPSKQIQMGNWNHIDGLSLADPNFNEPGSIDILLGADVYPFIITDGVRKGALGTPVAQCTMFGWILSGNTSTSLARPTHLQNFHINVQPFDELKKFWEIEEIPTNSVHTDEEIRCERHFTENYVRLPNGRYQVRLPFIDTNVSLGASKTSAIVRLVQMEKYLAKNAFLHDEYHNCITEYLTMDHMEPAKNPETKFMIYDNKGQVSYKCMYLPHHAVLKPSSTSTKVRVVFDASRQSSNGQSLNDVLLKGPTIQPSLFSILIRWRRFQIAFMADIHKMYRQIKMHPDDAEYQRIIWRETPEKPFQEYKLTTVTFGTKSAPFLAIRTMHQLAKDECLANPIGAEAILKEFYVDDLISGGNNLEEALRKKSEICYILESGGFELRKWASNSENILQTIPEDLREIQLPLSMRLKEVKALGIIWNPSSDSLSYRITVDSNPEPWTKRKILSEIAKIFDPIGWLSPTTILAKILIQTLWIVGIQWDEEVPKNITNHWTQYRNALPALQEINIPRWIRTEDSSMKIDLHGFCDASNKAYAAVVYVRVEQPNGRVDVNILSAKTKVAPIKTISLPKLELCGATLLAKLLIQVKTDICLNINNLYAWTDSTIVLAWLQKHASNWETFIANRVSHIQQTLEGCLWKHVPTDSNPADCASRGISPEKLVDHDIWWHGPDWLKKTEQDWPRRERNIETTIGLRRRVMNLHLQVIEHWDLQDRFSSLSKLLRVTAYCRRWFIRIHEPSNTRGGYLRAKEIQEALYLWIRIVQKEHFSSEIASLKTNRNLERKSRLSKLNPFLHSDGLLRVGGRLSNASLSFAEQHPIILPDKANLTRLIIADLHLTTMHGGSQLMLSLLRRKYWILNARIAVRSHIFKCMNCFRQKAQTRTQLMASLPDYRVNQARPFSHTGVDYCGPFELKSSKGKGIKSYKAYIAVFVCMVTKSIHIEIVSDLSTLGFLAAFRRFVSRRGVCSDIYSDCGSNFIGANGMLTRHKFEAIQQAENEIAQAIENQGIKWHFIPPSSPHFGGLWESGVKSIKTHLRKIAGNAKFTYEEFHTLLSQIEAALNSRPLTELSSDPEDITALTPGHFLIGGPLLAPAEPTLLDKKVSTLDRYHYIQSLLQTFWSRWSKEYLHRLQQRPKWASKTPNVQVNDLVLIKDDKLPPLQWLMGRIVETHPGKDGLVRVVTVKTNYSMMKRPITKICPLPIENPSTNQ